MSKHSKCDSRSRLWQKWRLNAPHGEMKPGRAPSNRATTALINTIQLPTQPTEQELSHHKQLRRAYSMDTVRGVTFYERHPKSLKYILWHCRKCAYNVTLRRNRISELLANGHIVYSIESICLLLFRISDVTRCYCCYYGLLSNVCEKKNLLFMSTLISTLSYRPKTQKFHTPEIFRGSWLTNSSRIQFVDIFVTHPHNKVYISNNMTLRSHVCMYYP
jgi:hypothetical protein